jgi:hypothetical protein
MPQMIIAAGQVAIPAGGGRMREFRHHAGRTTVQIASSFKTRTSVVVKMKCQVISYSMVGAFPDHLGAEVDGQSRANSNRDDSAR